MALIASSRLSSKGQVVIPKEVRQAQHWLEGQEITVISTPQGILLKPKSPFPPTSVAEVLARKKSYAAPAVPESEWDERIAQSLREEWP